MTRSQTRRSTPLPHNLPLSASTSLSSHLPSVQVHGSLLVSAIDDQASLAHRLTIPLPGEMFPLKIRAKGLSMTTAANWFFNWLLSFITPYLLGALDPIQSNVFWIWGSFCWIALVFVFFLVSLRQVNIGKESWLISLCRFMRRRTFPSNKSTSSTRTSTGHGSQPATGLPSEGSLLSMTAALAPTTTRRRDDRSPSRTSPNDSTVTGGFQRLKRYVHCYRGIPNKLLSTSNCLLSSLEENVSLFASTLSVLCSIPDIC